MELGILLVGIGKWEGFTLPAIKSVQEHDPKARLCVLDNGSKEPYPKRVKGVRMRRSDEIMCYSAAINYGFGELGDVDWLLSLNNDVLVHAPITPVIEVLEPRAVYSRQILQEKGVTWFGNWSCLLHKSVWAEVGKFDEKFLMCGFEDADYSIRAHKLGIPTRHVPLPVRHLWDSVRWQLPNYPEVRKANMVYLQGKHGIGLGQGVQVVAS